MEIFHLARAEDWAEALRTGDYPVSTLGRTVAEVGFVHCARADQVAGVFDRFYAGHGLDLMLLTVDTALLDVPWSEDPAPDDPGATYPHVHGPLPLAAVTAVRALDERGRPRS